MLGSLVGVLLFCTIQNAINQLSTLTSYTQPVVTGLLLIMVVAAQTSARTASRPLERM